jgi:hypothetical protein
MYNILVTESKKKREHFRDQTAAILSRIILKIHTLYNANDELGSIWSTLSLSGLG